MASVTALLAAVLVAAAALSSRAAAAAFETAGVSDGGDSRYKIPDGFLFGAGVSAIQTEGAWNEDGKGVSAADTMLHTDLFQKTLGSHDVAADSYHRFQEDVDAAKQLKLNVFRFSMSWSRLLPTTDATKPNEKARIYYHALIDAILAAGMTPVVTLFHFDHPQYLQDEFLGWEDKRMADKFAVYADYAFKEFGDKVKYWTTLNEPNQYCMYFNMLFVLGGVVKRDQVDIHRCMHNTILGHMKAYRIYKTKYFEKQQGQVGFTSLLVHAEPKTTSTMDIYAADAFNQVHAGKNLYATVYGDYPEHIKRLLPNLPEFTDEEKKDLKDSTDFIGLNIYNGMTASYDPEASSKRTEKMPIYDQLMERLPFVDVGNIAEIMQFDRIVPETMSRSLLWTWQQYGKPIIITESGYSGTDDQARSVYLSSYMRAFVGAANEYGVKVIGYCVWSLIDAFEWTAGYNRPFGIVHVDYENKSLNRTLKPYSSKFFQELAETRVIPYVERPATSTQAPNSAESSLTRGVGLTLLLGLLASLIKSH